MTRDGFDLHSPILWAIIGVELAFWLFLLAGVAARYLLRRTRLSTVLLLCVPLLDIVLLVLTAIDIGRGAEPSLAHAVAALYLGFTVAFGHPMIRSVDGWFGRRFGDLPPRPAPIKHGPVYVRGLWIEWLRLILMATIATVATALILLGGGRELPGSIDEAREAGPVTSIIIRVWFIAGIWFLAGPLYGMVFRGRSVSPAAQTTPTHTPAEGTRRAHGGPPETDDA